MLVLILASSAQLCTELEGSTTLSIPRFNNRMDGGKMAGGIQANGAIV